MPYKNKKGVLMLQLNTNKKIKAVILFKKIKNNSMTSLTMYLTSLEMRLKLFTASDAKAS